MVRVDDESRFEAPRAPMETPLHWSYRNRGRFYVEYENDSKPGNEVWYFDQAEGRLVGYDRSYHQLVGRFGPDGFTPAGVRPGERFHGELRYRTRGLSGGGLHGQIGPCLVCSDGVYTVDFARRTIRTLFTPAAGETVTYGSSCDDQLYREWKRVFVSTDKSLHVLTEDGAPVLSVPRVQDRQKDKYIVHLGGLENPERYFAWYGLTSRGGHWRSPRSSSPPHSIFTNTTPPVVSSPTAAACYFPTQRIRTPRPCSERLRR